ncbi:hypothetical protein [Kitasatospora sp. NPDC059327]|uniref:hypothetical protein n=1 Tax=Kitasatospora sp. NPDC059327 TaxID=3346803 RepID=UPI00367BA6A2
MKGDHMEALRVAGQRVIEEQGALTAALAVLSGAVLDAVGVGAAPDAVGAEYTRMVFGYGASVLPGPSAVAREEVFVPAPSGGGDVDAPVPGSPAPMGRDVLAACTTRCRPRVRGLSTADLASQLAGQAGVTEGTARKYLSAIKTERCGR